MSGRGLFLVALASDQYGVEPTAIGKCYWAEFALSGPTAHGTVTVDGSKNVALPLVAAAAALGCPVRLSNIPADTDIQTMLALLQASGWHVSRSGSRPRR